MKTSTLVLLGLGGYLLYRALQKTTTVTLPSATPALSASNTPAENAAAISTVLNAGLVAAGAPGTA